MTCDVPAPARPVRSLASAPKLVQLGHLFSHKFFPGNRILGVVHSREPRNTSLSDGNAAEFAWTRAHQGGPARFHERCNACERPQESGMGARLGPPSGVTTSAYAGGL